MRKTPRRQIDVFNLSFLDAICCAFGALLLLFVLSKFAEPIILEEVREELDAVIARYEQELFDLRGDTLVLNRNLREKREQLSQQKRLLARLQGELSNLKGQFATSQQDASVQNIIAGKLESALQELSAEAQRLLSKQPRRIEPSVGGIPVDSEYVIFIIDTSGSMKRYAWGLVQKKLQETLKIYPQVKGIQVMNDMGEYMFTQYYRRWIPDTSARRRAILSSLRTWRPFSNSSPVEGITTAISHFYAPDKKISLYVFGDEFTGGNMQAVIEAVDRMNRVTSDGSRRVRIHAIAFPTWIANPQGFIQTGARFATLMRLLSQKNGGTFVGLNSTKP